MRRMVVAALLGLSLSVIASANAQAQTQPLEASDREMVEKVHLACLWEIPTGQQAAERGSSELVRDVGKHIADDHLALDEAVRQVAEQLGVALPDRPSAEQQAWMAEITAKTGIEYDRTFANRIRAAHGTVFSLVADVRASTRNDVVRALAQRAVTTVLQHMTLSESTGLVQSTSLVAQTNAGSTVVKNNALSTPDLLYTVLLGLIAAGITLGLLRSLSRTEG
ncbi:DUF4142 domain-containing protein [Allokutzneria oryzae]|uniref:DUF4142 domain-containing protein n=1 Tax=Allokutzneria oryzae TaxID=1378989 RepID=A0ABV6A225_9PSEU